MNRSSQAHPAFDQVRSEYIDTLNLQVEQFEHRATGAMHYHLAADNRENVFLVALRTVPEDSSGVAHILEHTALCGSERFPVRDPFFMMLRRSLNTFMNAFTSSDWTAYPFASQNRKDFDNLLDVYLDAVFFARLDPLDFAQEGHRLEFAEPGDPQSELLFKGVVFNEMKGAMSSVTSTLWQTLCTHLFPTTTYHFNSGGDPEMIPNLSYGQLQDFYRSHYHPSNAIFMTFGDIPAHQHQQNFQEKALGRFDRLKRAITVPREQRLTEPLRVSASYAYDDADNSERKTHVVMAWLLGESTDLEQLLEAQLLSSVLLDNSASPLRKALETTNLGQAPSPLCGLEDSQREMVFGCGLEGSAAEHADEMETLVLEVIEQVAMRGVPRQRLEAVLHQLELHQREISGDGFPYGLRLLLTALGCATHYRDPIAMLNLDPVLEKLRSCIKDPEYIKQLARKLLLENCHRVRLVMSPDRELSRQRQQAEANRLAGIKVQLSESQRREIVRQAEQLAQRQEQVDDDSVLPKVTLEDIPTEIPEFSPSLHRDGEHLLTRYQQGTNGLVYQQAVAPLPGLSPEQWALLPYYSHSLTELGLEGATYLEVQDRQSATCGSIHAFTNMHGAIDDTQQVSSCLALSSTALQRNQQTAAQLMRDTLEKVRFDELERIRELVSQQRARSERSVTGNGHGLAMTAACAGMSPAARLRHQLGGLAGIKHLKSLDDSLQENDRLQAFSGQLAGLHAQVLEMPFQFLTVGDAEYTDEQADNCLQLWRGFAGSGAGQAESELAKVQESRREIWVTNTQVNFCAQAWPSVAVDHPDAAGLTVLGGFLRNGYLHRAIREKGGAYGGGASQDSDIGAFRFYSYRDPRLGETLADFQAAIEWLQDAAHGYEPLEQAILGVIGALDKPGSPAGEAKKHFYDQLFGRDPQQQARFRQRVLAQTVKDLQRVAERYLRPELACTAIITSQTGLEQAHDIVEEQGLNIIKL
ncbi:MAG: insulinase family protein [Halieaceae bacterium]|nr:insulinase family protein [Halieaceae bacterium]